ncbi:hypothetical protein [Mesorhizobium sp. STM 4661]|uniref:P-loop ATPase, Sll1717 family n=1 Tax=Mesorhizobium sp. STM 4661 TaxID=1297570 RepID=UPI0002BDB8E7|nr:hypothetical protein [Mesorhizobium sp. STM 4661]CCV11761.1 hypothetical protein MESS4_340083 [Mesorhizobium sp. STM 4661]
MTRELFVEYLKRTDARSDTDLARYTVQTRPLATLASSEAKPFVGIGLKGVGKTASFLTLQAMPGADVIQAINAETQEPQDLTASRPTLQYLPEIRSELALQALIALASEIDKTPALSKKVPQDLQQRLHVLLADLQGKAKEAFANLGGFSVLGFGISFRNKNKTASDFKLLGREKADEALKLLKEICALVSIRIVVDDPEAIFATDDRLNENLIAALIIAAQELQAHIKKNFKCVVLVKPNIMRALRRVDEFVNLELDSLVRLSWSDEELRNVILRRAEAAKVDLAQVFGAAPEPALKQLLQDSRSGPRDVLRRLSIQLDAYPNLSVTPENLELTIERYSGACFDQIFGAYERQYPGLARISLILFEGKAPDIRRAAIAERLDQMIAGSPEVLAAKDQPWARDATLLTDLLVQFGLVAVNRGGDRVLPYHTTYVDEAEKPDAIYSVLPGLRGRLRRTSMPASTKKKQGTTKRK